MLVAASSNTTTLLGARRSPSSPAAGKLQLTTKPPPLAVPQVQARRSSSPIGSLCVRISRDTNGFKALLNKIPVESTLSSKKEKRTPLFTINPTITHRCPQIIDINNSRDSLVADMCIFDPINPVPLTPYVRKENQSLKSPKFKYPSLKHKKFSLQINKTSSLLRVKLLKPYRPSAFCFLGSKLKSIEKLPAKRVIGKSSKESPSSYGQLQSSTHSTPSDTTNDTPLYIEKKTRRSRGKNIINSSLDLQELQLSSTRPITRSFLRMMNNASKTK